MGRKMGRKERRVKKRWKIKAMKRLLIARK